MQKEFNFFLRSCLKQFMKFEKQFRNFQINVETLVSNMTWIEYLIETIYYQILGKTTKYKPWTLISSKSCAISG